MALIATFEHITVDREVVHGPVECGWRTFTVGGRRILQLDTYGSSERKFQGKVSQSIQLDLDGATELMRILQESFPGL
jgi:hypothetical protein